MFDKIYGKSPYLSPTDMGVNMAGNCIIDDEIVKKAANQEIIRRYCTALCDKVRGDVSDSLVYKLQLLMKQAGLSLSDRPVIGAALQKEELTGAPAAAIELPGGRIVTGKTSPLLGSSAALLLNALKTLAGLDDSLHLISPEAIEPIQKLKINYLGNRNPRLHTDEILLALSICAATDPMAEKAMNQLPALRGCELHSSVILSNIDDKTLKKLGINVTCQPKYQTRSLYHAK
jgi:uncharacterized protein (UPF0371 family)